MSDGDPLGTHRGGGSSDDEKQNQLLYKQDRTREYRETSSRDYSRLERGDEFRCKGYAVGAGGASCSPTTSISHTNVLMLMLR